ncbi:bactofilin family protein [Thermohalobacter berrensis]|uniref:Cell shape determination protein CcmA n=1 Tax=Thermohalobacter berrensis TaxID=99594 RepID=A0A419T184_9FIRM|nr:polymer-forming cytoskeletal protein [Thermohalobacter berrensis]RKD31213.1 hypothetical protein BET03_03540 [Thermohalobacter berrensis]
MSKSKSLMVLEKNALFQGTLNASGDIKINGIFKGDIYSANNVYISSTGKIIGNVEADNIIINGEVNGNIKAKTKIHLTENSILTGDIITKKFIIDRGAFFNGKCKRIN